MVTSLTSLSLPFPDPSDHVDSTRSRSAYIHGGGIGNSEVSEVNEDGGRGASFLERSFHCVLACNEGSQQKRTASTARGSRIPVRAGVSDLDTAPRREVCFLGRPREKPSMTTRASRSVKPIQKSGKAAPNFERLVQKALKQRERSTQSLRDVIRSSERLTEKDYAVRINARD